MIQIPIFVFIILIIGIVGALALGVAVGFIMRKSMAEKKVGSAEQQAKRMINDAIKEAESAKKEAIISAKEEIFQMKKEADFDVKERRKEVSRLERRVTQKEETLDAKMEGLERKEAALQEKHQAADRVKAEVDDVLKAQIATLEKIAGLSKEDAKCELVAKLDSEMRHETAL